MKRNVSLHTLLQLQKSSAAETMVRRVGERCIVVARSARLTGPLPALRLN